MIDWSAQRVIVTGGGGFLGKGVCATLRARGVTDDRLFVPRSKDYDLTDEAACRRMYDEAFGSERASVVIHLAGEVGGIGAYRARPAEFFHRNLVMGAHVLEHARTSGMIDAGGRYVLVGTASSYPADAEVPLKEEDFWRGYPDAGGAAYGLAKRALAGMLRTYHQQYGLACAHVVPINLYGPGDHFDSEAAHVVPALVGRMVQAQERAEDLVCWGSGKATREFLYVDDAAEAIVRSSERVEVPEEINIGPGRETSIRELVETMAAVVGFEGAIEWDTTKPDGAPRRAVDVTRAQKLLDWSAAIDLRTGLERTVADYRKLRSGE